MTVLPVSGSSTVSCSSTAPATPSADAPVSTTGASPSLTRVPNTPVIPPAGPAFAQGCSTVSGSCAAAPPASCGEGTPEAEVDAADGAGSWAEDAQPVSARAPRARTVPVRSSAAGSEVGREVGREVGMGAPGSR